MSDKTFMEDGQCLMIKTKDRRKFFTFEENYIPLLEFSKLFNAEISVVKVKEAEVLDLSELAPALCDASYIQQQPKAFDVVEVKLPQRKRKRREILTNAQKIKAHITSNFLGGEIVTLRNLAKEFRKSKLTVACLCNHLTKVRSDLEGEGYQIIKLGGGKYQLEAPKK